MDDQLSEILAFEQARQAGGRVLEAAHHVCLELQLSLHQPLGHLLDAFGKAWVIVDDDEALHQCPAHQQIVEIVRPRHRLCGVIGRDQSA